VALAGAERPSAADPALPQCAGSSSKDDVVDAGVRCALRCRRAPSPAKRHDPERKEFVMIEASSFGTGQVFWSMLWFFLFFIWIWLLIVVFGDIFRSPDMGGWGKALWTIFVIVLPYLGVFVYLIARGHKMGEHAAEAAQQQDAASREYIRSMAGSASQSSAEEIARLADLRDRGVITEAEFQQAKSKALS
jgi:hypothetical protein